jgi:haloalkane dehalogenase
MTAKNGQYPQNTWLDKTEFPFKNNFFILPVGRMHYVDEGQGDPIVMVHGNPAWSFEFRNVIKEMSKTHRCLAPDHIGFGLSDKPEDWSYLPELHARNFELWMDSMNLHDITLVVNDWGGPIALSYALKYPEKFKKIVVLNTWLWSVENDPHFKKFSNFMGSWFGRFLIKRFNFFGKQVVKKAVGNSKKLTKHIHKHYYLHMQTPAQRKGCYVFPRQIIGSSKWLESLWLQRTKINSIPAVFLWGMKDIAFREKDLNTWLENWNNPTVIKLADIGHFPSEEAPDEVIHVLKY